MSDDEITFLDSIYTTKNSEYENSSEYIIVINKWNRFLFVFYNHYDSESNRYIVNKESFQEFIKKFDNPDFYNNLNQDLILKAISVGKFDKIKDKISDSKLNKIVEIGKKFASFCKK